MTVTVLAMHLAIGGNTEKEMREDVWQAAGLCDDLDAIGRPCSYADDTPECAEQTRRNRPCGFSIGNILRVLGEDPALPLYYEVPLLEPRWVPSENPTGHGNGGQWWKLQL